MQQQFPLAQVQSSEVFLASWGYRKHLLRHVWQTSLQSRENLYRFILRNVLTKLDRSPAHFALQSVVVAFALSVPAIRGHGNRSAHTPLRGSNLEFVC